MLGGVHPILGVRRRKVVGVGKPLAMGGGPTVGAGHRPGVALLVGTVGGPGAEPPISRAEQTNGDGGSTIVGIGNGLGQLYPGIGTVTITAVLVILVNQEVQTMANQKYPTAVRTKLKTHQRHHTTQSMTKKILPRLNFPVMVNM